ncbi:bromodomain-containing protein 7 isoform X1 [Schistocerca americana]|uniref:bromodomain-containing protein 7 isoform X1 n=1 Tax=Schistocerca americana TaxID=7009 RepID=UPI001F502A73|nr:bromodomain-containing protein 7 isoform X1 [Schistocerca americana]
MGSKKHKKHKSEKRERYEEKQFGVDKPALKLILKVNNASTPEHSNDASGPALAVPQTLGHAGPGMGSVPADEESRHSAASVQIKEESYIEKQHKKAKKKKKKKEKDKDREKHEKKHKHHHKEKRKRPRDESSQEDVSMGEESLSEPPSNKRTLLEGNVPIPKSIGEVQHSGQGLGSEQSGQVRIQTPAVSREPRSCVLRQRQERSALQKLLDYLLKGLEKRDPQQFFAWPVTDHIAPGYSQIIQNPMDFSTMKQKIDDNLYSTLHEFIEDFKLMCNNAMVYNHPDTIYYKAAKKLLHVGVKMMSPDKLKPLRSVLVYMSELSREELGFDLGFDESSISVCAQNTLESSENGICVNDDDSDASKENKRKMKENNRPLNKFEAIQDDMTPEEILEQAQKAAQAAADRLSMKRVNTKMGFLRQNKDGSTSLAILVPNDGIAPGTNERPISLGMLSGKLSHGTGQLQGFREDRRNIAKGVKPLYYGAFGSYAPSYDSTFANLTKEETELIYQTYGDETAVQYAESILDFAKDNDYTLTMVDNLLDLLTSGEHSKTKKILEERRKLREEEEKIKQMLEGKGNYSNVVNNENVPPLKEKKVDMNQLKTIKDFGLDTCFLDVLEKSFYPSEQKAGDEAMQSQLEQTSSLIQKLQQVQNDRLSLPPPMHLSQVPHASDGEVHLADRITESLKDMAKKLPPASVAPVPSIRKAMGILPSEIVPPNINFEKLPMAVRSQQVVNQTSAVMMDVDNVVQSALTQTSGSEMPVILSEPLASGHVIDVGVEGTSSHAEHNEASVSLVPDLESELREFLESEPALSNSPLHDDKTIEEILSES